MTDGTAGEMDPIDRTALIAATLPLLVAGAGGNYENPDPLHFSMLLAGVAGLTGALMRKQWAGPLVLFAVLILGITLRAAVGDNRASDVMLTTNEAIGVFSAGGNPYTHVYAMTNPPGGLFGYPPGEFVFYWFVHLFGFSVFRVDVMCGIVALGLISTLAPLIGYGLSALAISVLAAAVDLIFHSADGSNDTTAAFLAILGVVSLAWSFASRGRGSSAAWWLSAVAFGWVVAFKEYTLPIALFVGLYLWRLDARRARGWAVAALATFAVLVLPFFVWNPAALIAHVGGALIVHQNVWGRNLWHDYYGLLPGNGQAIAPVIPFVAVLALCAVVAYLWRQRAPSLGAAFLYGCAVLAVVFMFTRWTTSVYYVFLLPAILTGVALTLGAERSQQTPQP